MFGTGSYATIWKVENKGNYDVCQLSTQKKNKETGNYETDFAEQGVRFVGKAHGFHPQEKQRIKITNCGVTNKYNKETKRKYYTFVVFDYELVGEQPQASNTIEEDLPFIF